MLRDLTPSPISELLAAKQSTASGSPTPSGDDDGQSAETASAPLVTGESAPSSSAVVAMETLDDSSATQPVKSPEANLAAPKGFLLKFNNTPEVTKKSVYIGNLPWVVDLCHTKRELFLW